MSQCSWPFDHMDHAIFTSWQLNRFCEITSTFDLLNVNIQLILESKWMIVGKFEDVTLMCYWDIAWDWQTDQQAVATAV